ncbi:MAG: hypothetical protein ACODAU_02475 [Myxococcota bacterium]
MRVVTIALVAWWAGAGCPPVRADEARAPIDPLTEVTDPLEVGLFVERHGDPYVLLRLRSAHPVDTRLAAVRSTPWLREPERALEELAGLAAGRDPHLAPAAAWAAHRIATDLDPSALERREVTRSELAPARRRLRRLAEDGTARRDLRRLAAFAEDALGRLHPPADAE